jgi:hypothetical protein
MSTSNQGAWNQAWGARLKPGRRDPLKPSRYPSSLGHLLGIVCVASAIGGCAAGDRPLGASGVAAQASAVPADGTFRPLFNGKTLDGWEGDPSLWSVEDGAITGRTTIALAENTFLIHQGRFADFEIRLKYRFPTPVGNSGLQYRSRPDRSRPYSVIGYQANVVTQNADRTFAMLWEERGRELLARCGETVRVVDSTDPSTKGFARQLTSPATPCDAIRNDARPFPQWNDYIIVAKGNRLMHWLNGRLTVDVIDDDADARSLDGAFALQIHRDIAMTVQFKDIEVRAYAESAAPSNSPIASNVSYHSKGTSPAPSAGP